MLGGPVDPNGWEFQYAQGAINKIKPEDKMSLEEAKEFGHLYGVCCVCGRTLTNESSIEAGIGPRAAPTSRRNCEEEFAQGCRWSRECPGGPHGNGLLV